MLIKDMFEKDITRYYDDVIKVDDDISKQDIFIELDEFIVTEELLSYFNEFFTNFTEGVLNSKKDIGVWISGFFGSGKSHFLKILAYLLANDLEFEGKKPIDFFIKDKKIKDSQLIRKIEDSSNFDNDVKLFNVLATSENKLINVFYKMFNEIQGYCGEFLHVADFEKKLVYKNKYLLFKNRFEEIHGQNWESVRSQFSVFRDEIIQTLNDIEFMSEDAINKFLDTLELNMNISIEKFAEEVNEYCSSQNKNVIFLADEMGQFIAENPNLKSELQTIVEKLSVKCNGKAWVIVTSQHKISNIFKDDDIQDFAKIKGRFRTQLNLTSSNVDEVIRLRFLEKKDNAKNELTSDYNNYSSTLKNIIFFEDSSDMESYDSKEEYIDYYPFIPYQFNLLQESIIKITDVVPDDSSIPYGERSMITCFKEAAVEMRNEENGYLIPFYMFFDSIEKFIDPLDLKNINNAKDNKKLDDYDLKVLKVLFLIKFLDDDYLNPTLNNISTLMISNVNENINDLRVNVDESLNKLINQAFVHRNGNFYSYRTKKEQKIDASIKNQKIEITEIKKDFQEYIKKIYPNKKYKLDTNHTYPINIKIDNVDENKNGLKINIITSYFEYEDNDLSQSTLTHVDGNVNQLKGLSDNKKEIFIKLYSDDLIFSEIKGKLQIKKYLNNKKILFDRKVECEKEKEANEKDIKIKELINNSFIQSDIYLSGQKTEISSKNAAEIIDASLDILFSNVYYNKHFMDDINPSKDDIYLIIKEKNQTTLADGEISGSNALIDMETFINKIDSENIKTIFSKYKDAPYGFIPLEISWIIAKLFVQKRISLVLDTTEIFIDKSNADEIADYILLNDSIISNKLYLQKRKNISPKWIKSAKNIYKDLSDEKIDLSDENLMIKFKEVLNNKINEIDSYLYEIKRFSRFPGNDIFLKVKELFIQCTTKNKLFEFYKFVFENQNEIKKNIDNLNKVSSFYNDYQKDIFIKSCEIYDEHEDNKISLNNSELNSIVDKINSIIIEEEPYSDIPDLKQLNDDYETKFNNLLNEKQNNACNEIDKNLNELIMLLDSDNLIQHFKIDIENDFNKLKYKVNKRRNIHNIVGYVEDSIKLKADYKIEISQFSRNPPKIESIIYIDEMFNEEVKISDKEDLDMFLNKIRLEIKRQLDVNDIVKIRK